MMSKQLANALYRSAWVRDKGVSVLRKCDLQCASGLGGLFRHREMRQRIRKIVR